MGSNRNTTVDGVSLTCYKRRFVGCQEHDQRRDLLGLCQPSHRLSGDELLPCNHGVRLDIDPLVQRRGLDGAWANGVAAHALANVIDGHTFGQANDRGFGGTVNEAVGQPLDAAAHAGHVDDARAATRSGALEQL